MTEFESDDSSTNIDMLNIPLGNDSSVTLSDEVGVSDKMSEGTNVSSAVTRETAAGDAITNDSHEVDIHVREGTDGDPTIEHLGKGQRTKIPSTRLRGYVRNTICKLSPPPSSSSLSQAS
ncbi:hypothetical protein L195_g058970, partial [Trifolium pratense]